MNKYSSIFSQLLSLFPRLEFERLVKLTGTEYAAKGFSSWGHYGAMLFCQKKGSIVMLSTPRAGVFPSRRPGALSGFFGG